MGGDGHGPEMALVSESLANAQARIRFFRLAFGAAGDEPIAAKELQRILADLSRGARQSMTWQGSDDVPRAQARLVFLAILCLESALPFGGDINVTHEDGVWHVTGNSPKLLIDEKLWDALNRPGTQVAASEVQFALLPLLLEDEGKRPRIRIDDSQIAIRF